MKVSLNWASWHSKTDPAPKGLGLLAKKIGAQLGEIEEIIKYEPRYKNIFVVRVVSCEKHPNADKLSLCLIDDNGAAKEASRNKKGLVQVVCGASNARAGVLAAWIPPGETVPSTIGKDPFVLESRELRGELSNGMLASPAELDIYDEHDGILEIEDNGKVKPGTSLSELYGLNDVVIDIENKMFTHRPDCFGVLGVARELAGINGQVFSSPEWYKDEPEFTQAKGLTLKVINKVPQLAPRFMAVALANVSVKASPVWLQAGLKRVGIKPINNIVDITNYLMYITGQPLHAYDYDKVAAKSSKGAVLEVRHPRKGEKLKLLNGKTIEPRTGAVMIATDKEIIGIGGVMGGADTEVDNSTKNVILECANFDLYSVRKTSMEHGLFTDAVTRFSKGQSPLQNGRVLKKAMDLIVQEAGAAQASEVIDDVNIDDEVVQRDSLHEPVTLSAEFINSRLGLDLSAETIAGLLRNVEFVAEIIRGSNLLVKAPFWRTDIAIAEDVVEEIGRLYGYDHLPKELPMRVASPAVIDQALDSKKTLRNVLASLGARETLNYGFVHGKLLEKANQSPDNSYKVNNALSPDLQYYRQSLTPSLLENIYPNIRLGSDTFALFEINKVHDKASGLNDEKVPAETDRVAFVYADKRAKDAAYFTARAYLDALAAKLGIILEYTAIDKTSDDSLTRPYEAPRSAQVTAAGEPIGVIGEFDQEVASNFKLPAFCAGFEVNLAPLLKAVRSAGSNYAQLSRYPSIAQDICLRVPADSQYGVLAAALNEALANFKPEDVVCEVAPLDIYSPDNGAYKNITFGITLFSYERTLKEEVASKLLNEVEGQLAKKIGAKRV